MTSLEKRYEQEIEKMKEERIKLLRERNLARKEKEYLLERRKRYITIIFILIAICSFEFGYFITDNATGKRAIETILNNPDIPKDIKKDFE